MQDPNNGRPCGGGRPLPSGPSWPFQAQLPSAWQGLVVVVSKSTLQNGRQRSIPAPHPRQRPRSPRPATSNHFSTENGRQSHTPC